MKSKSIDQWLIEHHPSINRTEEPPINFDAICQGTSEDSLVKQSPEKCISVRKYRLDEISLTHSNPSERSTNVAESEYLGFRLVRVEQLQWSLVRRGMTVPRAQHLPGVGATQSSIVFLKIGKVPFICHTHTKGTNTTTSITPLFSRVLRSPGNL